MSNKKLFKSSRSVSVPVVDTVNNAGGKAYSLENKAALAQYAMTGCFNGTYYTSADNQLETVLKLAQGCDPKFVAKLAVYSRQEGLMKDMPAFLAAVVASKDSDLLQKIFAQVVDSPKMLRNFVQIVRSGVTGRKSFGTRPKRLLQNYLENLSDEQLFKADVGNDPSLQDIIKMVRPKPGDKKRSALYAYLLDKEYNKKDLLPLARAYEDFKKDPTGELPDVPFQMLTALPLTDSQWKELAENMTWNQTRMNLNTMLRHNVFNDKKMVDLVAAKLKDEVLVRKAKVFPYQLFSAYLNVDAGIPVKITNALQDAAEIAVENIPEIDGQVYVLPDVSGSMSSPVTGYRVGATTKMNCIHVAALVSACFLRKNPETVVMPFDTSVHRCKLNPRDSIMTNASILAKFGGGGTNCSLPLTQLNAAKAKGKLVMYVSDNESWVDSTGGSWYNRGTATMEEWKKFKTRNAEAKLVCVDVVPNRTTQAKAEKDVLNIGGFNDTIFDVVKRFTKFGNDSDLWIKTIESTVI